jgi:hypothetical protein
VGLAFDRMMPWKKWALLAMGLAPHNPLSGGYESLGFGTIPERSGASIHPTDTFADLPEEQPA